MQPCYKCTLVVKIACNTKTCGSLPALEILLIVQIHSMVIFLVFYPKPFNIFYLFLSLHFRNKPCASRLGFRNPFADRLKRTAAGSVHCSRLPSECWSQRCVGPGGRRQHRLHGRGSAPAPGWARWAQDAAGGPSSLSQIVRFSSSLCVTPHLGQWGAAVWLTGIAGLKCTSFS